MASPVSEDCVGPSSAGMPLL